MSPARRGRGAAGPVRRVLTGVATVVLLVPVVEIVVAILVARWIGVDATLLLIILGSAAGVWLVRLAGLSAARQLSGLRTGSVIGRDVGDAGLRFVAAALLLVPGLVTGLAGLLLLVPPVRSVVAGILARRVRRRFEVAARGTTVRGEVVDGVTVTSWVEETPGTEPGRLTAGPHGEDGRSDGGERGQR